MLTIKELLTHHHGGIGKRSTEEQCGLYLTILFWICPDTVRAAKGFHKGTTDIDGWIRAKEIHLPFESTGQADIIAVCPSNKRSTSLSKPAVSRARNAFPPL